MTIVQSIHIQNIRSLKDTGDIRLTPITLLVGGNSSGKSTFLRTFPLLKQSIRKRTDGPLLWAGDMDDYVDFGSFKETITNNDTAGEISFSFVFQTYYREKPYFDLYDSDELNKSKDVLPTTYSFFIKQLDPSDSQAYVSRVNIKIFQSEFSFQFSPKSNEIIIKIDGKKFNLSGISGNEILHIDTYIYGSVLGFNLPSIRALSSKLFKELFLSEDGEGERFGFVPPYQRNVLSCLGSYFCQGQDLSEIMSRVPQGPKEFERLIDNACKKIKTLTLRKQKDCISALKLIYFYKCFPSVDEYLNSYFRQVHYIAPLRATAERYYRLRNLSIDEVDYQGKNLSIFLDGLRRSGRLAKFNAWTDKLFGFHVQTKKETGHLSMQISLLGKQHSVNLSDTGFGFSQILPIITQLWDLSTRQIRRRNNIPTLIAIEQPELHLHPSLQAKLVDAFIDSVALPKTSLLQVLLETHSETLINCFGQAIAEKKIKEDQVSVVLFNNNKSNGLTEIQYSTFDENGYLTNWPIGFFAARR